MMNIIKSNLYRYSKNVWSYILLGIIILGCSLNIYVAMAITPSDIKDITGMNTILSLLNPMFIVFIFLLFVVINLFGDYQSSAIKNIFGRGIARMKYLQGTIITISGLTIIVWLVTSILIIIMNSSIAGFGKLDNPFNLFLALVMNMIFVIAMVTIVSVLTMIFKNGVIGFIVCIIIININSVIIFLNNLLDLFLRSSFRLSLGLRYITISDYIKGASSNINDTKMLLFGIYAGIIYIVVFMIIGKFMLRRQDVK